MNEMMAKNLRIMQIAFFLFLNLIKHFLINSIMKRSLIILSILILSLSAEAQLKALIIDGQNNHVVWPKSTIMMKQYLEETGLFEVDIMRTQFTWKAEREKDFLPLAGVGETEDLKDPKADPDFAPAFKNYDVIISNFGWKAADWPEKTQKALEKYMKKGGGAHLLP